MTEQEAKQILQDMQCTTPAGGTRPGGHCAACCYGTGFDVTGWDEVALVNEALAVLGQPALPWLPPEARS
jgi:hypothetical protein